MNELDLKISVLKTALLDIRQQVDKEISYAKKFLWRRNWTPILANLPLFACGCLDFYKFHYVEGILTMFGVEGLVFIQWTLWNARLNSARHWKKKWAALVLDGEQILKRMEEHKERGFE